MTPERSRRRFLMLAGLGVAGTLVELLMLRHWDSPIQLLPFAGAAVLAATVVSLVRRADERTARVARVLAVVVTVIAVVGVAEHVRGNVNAGPLDFRYTERWPTMSTASRWWAALTEAVGPAPTLAPLVLAQGALCVWFATLGIRKR